MGSKSGYIQSKSIMKLVLALKAKAMPLRSRTKPTKVRYKKEQHHLSLNGPLMENKALAVGEHAGTVHL